MGYGGGGAHAQGGHSWAAAVAGGSAVAPGYDAGPMVPCADRSIGRWVPKKPGYLGQQSGDLGMGRVAEPDAHQSPVRYHLDRS